MTLYTAGYRDSVTEKRLEPELFYSALPEGAAVVDIRSHPYSPFAPDYTGRKRIGEAVERWKPGVKVFHHLKALGNTHRESSGKRISPPIYVDADAGFTQLETFLQQYIEVVIFCACSHLTQSSTRYRCHRFYVAEEMASRIAGLSVKHMELYAASDSSDEPPE